MGKAMCGAAELGRKASKGVALIASVLNWTNSCWATAWNA